MVAMIYMVSVKMVSTICVREIYSCLFFVEKNMIRSLSFFHYEEWILFDLLTTRRANLFNFNLKYSWRSTETKANFNRIESKSGLLWHFWSCSAPISLLNVKWITTQFHSLLSSGELDICLLLWFVPWLSWWNWIFIKEAVKKR